MTPRERALTRLRWVSSFGPSPGQDRLEAGLHRRLCARLELKASPPRPEPGASLGQRSDAIRRARAVAVGPHAPLLMRIVRDPFPMKPSGAARRPLEGPDHSRPRVEPGPRLAEVIEELKEALRHGAPMRQIVHRPAERPRPFARIREQTP